MQVSPENLRAAATTIGVLAAGIPELPPLDAARGVRALPESAIAAALAPADGASSQAKHVLAARHGEIAYLLELSADTYRDTDVDAAARLAAVGDLNAAGV